MVIFSDGFQEWPLTAEAEKAKKTMELLRHTYMVDDRSNDSTLVAACGSLISIMLAPAAVPIFEVQPLYVSLLPWLRRARETQPDDAKKGDKCKL